MREAWAEEDDQENQYRATPELQRAVVGRGTSMTTGRGTGSQTRARLSSRRGPSNVSPNAPGRTLHAPLHVTALVWASHCRVVCAPYGSSRFDFSGSLGAGGLGAGRRGSELTGSADFMGDHLARRRSSISHSGDLSALGRTSAQANDLAAQIASGRAGKGSGVKISAGRRRSSIADVQANAAAVAAAATAAHAAKSKENGGGIVKPSMHRARSTTIKLSGTDSAALSAQIQAQAAAAQRSKPALRTARSTTIKLEGSDAARLSATLRAKDAARRRQEGEII